MCQRIQPYYLINLRYCQKIGGNRKLIEIIRNWKFVGENTLNNSVILPITLRSNYNKI